MKYRLPLIEVATGIIIILIILMVFSATTNRDFRLETEKVETKCKSLGRNIEQKLKGRWHKYPQKTYDEIRQTSTRECLKLEMIR